jgi:hypothetical protein
MFGIRTWKVFADEDNFLGYEYARDQDEVHTKAAKKFGAPEKWGITSYKVELIPWSVDAA